MDEAIKSRIAGFEAKMGKPLSYFTDIVNNDAFAKHSDAVNYLKETFGIGHGHANMIVHLAKENTSLHIDDEVLIAEQYKGKEHWKPLYENLINTIKAFGNDVTISPKKTYVSLRRSKQFGLLNPASKNRFEIGINLKNQGTDGRLIKIDKPNSMCTHKFDLAEGEAASEVIAWLKKAYDQA